MAGQSFAIEWAAAKSTAYERVFHNIQMITEQLLAKTILEEAGAASDRMRR